MNSKFNSILLNSAIAANTGVMELNQFPPVEKMLQIANQTMRLKDSKIYSMPKARSMTRTLTLSKLGEAVCSVIAFYSSPYCNGSLVSLKMHPSIESLLKNTVQSGAINGLQHISYNSYIIENFLDSYQREIQTRHFHELKANWEEQYSNTAKSFDISIKEILKHVLGFEIQEITLELPVDGMTTDLISYSLKPALEQKELNQQIIDAIRDIETDRVLAIFSKLETNFPRKIKQRLIVILQRDFSDDPEGFKNKDFIEELNHFIGLNSANRLTCEQKHLNGFLRSNLFLKNSPKIKDQLKLLKTYLIETDMLIRVGNSTATFEILYSKYGT